VSHNLPDSRGTKRKATTHPDDIHEGTSPLPDRPQRSHSNRICRGWVREIKLVLPCPTGQELSKVAIATFDTGSTHNWISRRLVKSLGIEVGEPPQLEPVVVQFDGSEMRPVGTVILTWYFPPPIGRRTFEGDFLVHDQQNLDIVIGGTTIEAENILEWNPAYVLANRFKFFIDRECC
jgi:hypothetical protein